MWDEFVKELCGILVLICITQYNEPQLGRCEFLLVKGQEREIKVFLGIGTIEFVGEYQLIVLEGENDGGLIMKPNHAHVFFVRGVGLCDGVQSFCDVHGGCIGGQQILFLRLVLKCQGLLGVDFTDFGLWHAGDIGLSECRRNPLDVAVEIYPCYAIFELGGVFDDLVAERLILGVYREIVNNVVVVDPQNLLGLSAVLGDMTPKYVHVAKLNQFWAAWLLISFWDFLIRNRRPH